MTTSTPAADVSAAPVRSPAFERFAGICAILAAIAGLAYSASFVVLRDPLYNSLFLMLGGLLSSAALVALYDRVRDVDGAFALWALLLSGAGALGAAIHGGYDLANVINPAPEEALQGEPANPVDPRGLLTFGLSGVGLFILARLARRGRRLPAGLVYVGYLSALLWVVLDLARLIVLAPANPIILVPALVEGFVINPLWYAWLGFVLLRSAARGPAAGTVGVMREA